MSTVRVLFLETRTVRRENGPTYEEGKEYVLSTSSARHFVDRGVARVVSKNPSIEKVEEVRDPEGSPDESEGKEGGEDEAQSSGAAGELEGQDSGGDGKRTEQLPASAPTASRGRRSGNRN